MVRDTCTLRTSHRVTFVFFFFFSILIKNCTRFVEIDDQESRIDQCRIFIILKFVCSTFSKFLFINVLNCNILLYRNKKKKGNRFCKRVFSRIRKLGEIIKKKRYVIRKWSAYDFVGANRVECQLG